MNEPLEWSDRMAMWGPTLQMILGVQLALTATGSPLPAAPIQPKPAISRDVQTAQHSEFSQVIASEPTLRLRGWQSDTGIVRFGKIAGAVRLADGSLIVADAGASRLVRVSPDGRESKRISEIGRGRGEFASVSQVHRFRSDSVLVSDVVLQRCSILDAAGHIVRSITYPGGATASRTEVVGVLADGSLVMSQLSGNIVGAVFTSGPVRDTISVYRFVPDSEAIYLLHKYPASQAVVVWDSGRRTITDRPFGATGALLAANTAVLFASGATGDIDVRRVDGVALEPIKLPVEMRRITGDEISQHRSATLSAFRANEAQQRAMRIALETRNYPRYHPTISRLIRDSAGRLWAKEPPRPGAKFTRWLVVDAEGKFVGAVALPSAFEPLDIGTDFVLGSATSDDGVELRLYAFVSKSGS